MTAPAATRTKVFISYARLDGSALAEELVTALGVAGFDAYLDRHDIAAGEDWERRLDSLIREADTVVFVITPLSVASARCAWEVRQAQQLAKRIIPVAALPVPEAAVPAELQRLNHILFTPGTSFARGLAQLAEALRVDLDWIREHTRLGELARRWEARDGAEALLLRDTELAAAQAWQGEWRAGLPAVTDLQRAYVAAGVQAQEARASAERERNEAMARANAERAEALARQETAMRSLRRRTLLAGFGVGGLSLGLAGTLLWAQQQRERALEAHVRREAARRDITGQVVAYAASPGQMAMDNGAQGTSPYTAALLEELARPMVSLWTAMSVTSMRVSRDSGGRQRPFVSSDMNGDLYLGEPSPTRRQRALVIAVGRFRHVEGMQFEGVYRDLQAWSAFLRERRFEVAELRDPTVDELREALETLRVVDAERQTAAPRKVGLRPIGPPASAASSPKPAAPPPDTLLMVVYSGYGFLSGARRFLAGTDVQPGPVKDGVDPAARTAMAVDELEASVRHRSAASVLVYDTQFL